jgi:hypothetical protein
MSGYSGGNVRVGRPTTAAETAALRFSSALSAIAFVGNSGSDLLKVLFGGVSQE